MQPQPRVPGLIYKDRHQWGIAVLLSLCLCAFAGQIYNGQAIKGIVMLVVGTIFIVFSGGFGLLIYWPVMLIDAGMIGYKLQQGQGVREWEWF